MAHQRASFSPEDPTSPLSISPLETAVLLMDYQHLVLVKFPDVAPSVLTVAADLRDWALKKGMPVFHCLIDTRPGVQPAPRNKSSPKWKMYQDVFAAKPALGREADILAPPPDSDHDPSAEFTVMRTPGLVSASSWPA